MSKENIIRTNMLNDKNCGRRIVDSERCFFFFLQKVVFFFSNDLYVTSYGGCLMSKNKFKKKKIIKSSVIKIFWTVTSWESFLNEPR